MSGRAEAVVHLHARFWRERRCPYLPQSHPNSVVPTAADHRKAMIRGVEGPCVFAEQGYAEVGESRD